MAEMTPRHVAIVVDDAQLVLSDPQSRKSLQKAAVNGTPFTSATSVNVPQSDQRPLRSILTSLSPSIGLHAVFDEIPKVPRLYPKDAGTILGEGGLLHLQREAFERREPSAFGLVGQALTNVVIQALERQLYLFEDIFRVEPQHLSPHNGWGGSREVNEALITVAERHKIPVRMSRQWFTPDVATLPNSPLETGHVIDEHNIPHMSPPTELDGFVDYVSRTLNEKNLLSGEVLKHIHEERDRPFYQDHAAILAHKRITHAFLQRGIALVTPRQLIPL